MDLDILLLAGPSSPPVLKQFHQAALPCRVYEDLVTLADALEKPGGIIVIARGLAAEEVQQLRVSLDRQPTWSDWPVLVVGLELSDPRLPPMLAALGNVLHLPPPFDSSLALGAAHKGLRERAGQYRLRDSQEKIQSADGNGAAGRKMVHDENAALEAQVQVRTEELQRAIKALEAFSYTIAHDLRAPLRAMQGLATALFEDYSHALDGDGLDYAQRIVAAAARMDRLIQDLLAYSRLDRLDINLGRVELEAVTDTVLMALAKEIKSAGAEVRVRRPLPVVWSQPLVLEQVLTHLLSNALKFVAAGTAPRIEVRSEEWGENIRVWVVDNGIGIEPRHHEKIFSVFERLHGEETYPGTGIGLALVRKGAARVGGASGVESHAGRGSRFWIDLPKGPSTSPPSKHL